ncbi:NAD(P)/FAD-dependent oxidoreductase [Ornithinimicrobium sp. W1665]|uniref:NAD(P)/FAD-dependent oxidoreductase n=1 Tax=Ornithinimicrobium sp. W1665 TaxID=3416666 RepID=UPI003CEBDFB3
MAGTLTPEVIVVGGGPAGLQATLTLARVHRQVVLLDDGQGRNASAGHLHNLITRDGTPPAELRRIAREELAAYPTVEVREVRADRVRDLTADGEPAFVVELEDGSHLRTARVVLATGVRDELPPIPGLAELWGDLVVQCPFCHGHELAGRRVGVLGAGAAAHTARIMRPVASEVLVLADGDELPEDPGAVVRTEEVCRLERLGDEVRVVFAQGEPVVLAGIFVATTSVQATPFAEQLGLALNPSGAVRVDEHGRTSLPGVYAAGDLAHVPALATPVPSIAQAVAAGSMVGGCVVANLVDGG